MEYGVLSYVQKIVDQLHLVIHGERAFRKAGQEARNNH